jgi:protein-tyrosine phosphatase
MVRVLFVCLGNICRSPTAEGVFRQLVAARGLSDRIEVDSAGTGGWHAGDPPDPRTVQAAARRGLDLSTLRARQVRREDFAAFDHVLAMDEANLRALELLRGDSARARLRLFLACAPDVGCTEVPDPYDGGPAGFERVLDLCEAAARALLDEIARDLPP